MDLMYEMSTGMPHCIFKPLNYLPISAQGRPKACNFVCMHVRMCKYSVHVCIDFTFLFHFNTNCYTDTEWMVTAKHGWA